MKILFTLLPLLFTEIGKISATCASQKDSNTTQLYKNLICSGKNAAARKVISTLSPYFSEQFTRKTEFRVCTRPVTKFERFLAKILVTLRRFGVKEYLRKHKKCFRRDSKASFQQQQRQLNQQRLQSPFSIPQDAVWTFKGCLRRKRNDALNTVQMCRECAFDIRLSERFIPRDHLHVTCGETEHNDITCLHGEGVCVMNQAFIPVLYDKDNVGFSRLSEWIEVKIELTKSCSCQALRGGLIDSMFVREDSMPLLP